MYYRKLRIDSQTGIAQSPMFAWKENNHDLSIIFFNFFKNNIICVFLIER